MDTTIRLSQNVFEKQKHWIFVTLMYVGMLIWWILIQQKGLVDTPQNYYFGLSIGLFSVIGGIIGIRKSKKWGAFKSVMGKAILALSFGLLSWGIGSIIFAYYNIYLSIAVPYPSAADVAYIISWPLWAFGMYYFLQSLGVKYRLKTGQGKLIVVLVPIVILILSYFLFFTIARQGSLDFGTGWQLFFSLAYPLGDIVILTMAVLMYSIAVNYLGGTFRVPILIIIVGFFLNYLSDFSFSYTTTHETFYVASWVDLLFTSTIFVLSLGVSLLDSKIVSDQSIVK